MRTLPTLFFVLLIASLASCDLRSGTAKEEMERYDSAPTPTFAPQPTGTPIEPADIVNVDINLEGDAISVDGHSQNKTPTCTKFNRVNINGDDSVVTIKGACRQIMINGDRNRLTVDAAMGFVLNGSENIVKYSRFVNGKQPVVTENQTGNTIEKVSAATMTTSKPKQRIVK